MSEHRIPRLRSRQTIGALATATAVMLSMWGCSQPQRQVDAAAAPGPGAATTTAAAAPATPAQGLQAWQQVTAVLQHPRCLNCHQPQTPLQGNLRRVHIPAVARGDVGMGVGTMTCTACHNTSGNNETSNTPGAEGWMLAPASMNWQGLDSAQLCAQMKDKRRNGNRSGEQLIEHMRSELVVWGWRPGGDRTPPPISYEQFMREFGTWVHAGAPCPG